MKPAEEDALVNMAYEERHSFTYAVRNAIRAAVAAERERCANAVFDLSDGQYADIAAAQEALKAAEARAEASEGRVERLLLDSEAAHACITALKDDIARHVRIVSESEARTDRYKNANAIIAHSLKFFADESKWGPVADYSEGYWYMTGKPWIPAAKAIEQADAIAGEPK